VKEDLENIVQSFGAPFSGCQNFEVLENGDMIFSHMLSRIEAAQNYILFETFIYWNGKIAQQFTDALIKKAKEGVKCYVIFDGYGCQKVDQEMIQKMLDNGIELTFFNPLTWSNFFGQKPLNQRTHRKILIIDGKDGYIGGVGVADKWMGNASNPSEWRDLHFYIQGRVLNDLQSAFLDNWMEYETAEIDPSLLYYHPEDDKAGDPANIIMSSPSAKHNNLNKLIKLAINKSKKSLKIMTPYFIPSHETLQALKKAAKRGVDVQIIIPGQFIDQKIVTYCSRYFWLECIQSGIKLFRYQPTFNHSKVFLIDDNWVSVGSSNFDYRSLKLNEEANLNVLSQKVARKVKSIFEKDKKLSKPVSEEELINRPFATKLLDWLASSLRRVL
tara:strand:+ start:13409 stop:14566 length:1158 start_codon:yes stop_codon:yes gene_type:complete